MDGDRHLRRRPQGPLADLGANLRDLLDANLPEVLRDAPALSTHAPRPERPPSISRALVQAFEVVPVDGHVIDRSIVWIAQPTVCSTGRCRIKRSTRRRPLCPADRTPVLQELLGRHLQEAVLLTCGVLPVHAIREAGLSFPLPGVCFDTCATCCQCTGQSCFLLCELRLEQVNLPLDIRNGGTLADPSFPSSDGSGSQGSANARKQHCRCTLTSHCRR
mmetsp:Transcript_17776/g.50623  ORF Transcript_17776/g.50623 Transcript_17776/m.50623 type:complete len:219 (+) Transcript_17776:569-1225(+)